LEMQLPDLWKYFTDWVSLRDQSSDSNRRRWPVKAFWAVVRGAVPFFGVVTGIVRIAQRRPRMDSLARMGRGVMVTMAALVQTTTGSSSHAAIGFLVEQTREWMAEDGFNLDVTRRAGKLAFMT